MAETFPLLFSPIQVGKYTLRNRIVNTGHATGYGLKTGGPGEQHIYYHRERARGGVGMIIMETMSVHKTGIWYYKNLDESVVPWFRRIADAVHPYGVPVLQQLTHFGKWVTTNLGAYESHALGPTADPVATFDLPQIPTHEMDQDDIREIVGAFGQAARRSMEGGLDGIQITMGTTTLIPQFFSKNVNKRKDRYGGSLENRCRFALEVLQEVRSQIGPQKLLGARFSDDMAGLVTPLEDLKEIIPALVGTGLLDFVDVKVAGAFNRRGGVGGIPPYYVTPGQFTYLAAEIRKLVKVPVIGVGRINHPALAEDLLKRGEMDLVGMVRELIADPHLPNKAREGRLDDIRRCMACNQSCAGHGQFGLWVTCVYNPVTGREKEWADIPLATTKKKVVVVGGGPAGLEAARVAALRGHQVVLLERSGELGGQTKLVVKTPKREDFGEIRTFFETQLAKLRVEVRLNTEATAEMVAAEKPDAVVIATGSTPYRPDIPGVDGRNVVTTREVLDGSARVGQRVVVVDTQGLHPAVDVADLLSERGAQVQIVTGLPYVAPNLPQQVWTVVAERLMRKGVVMTPFTGVAEIGEDNVTVFSTITMATNVLEGVDTVVLATGGKADDSLHKELKGRLPEVYAIGDCWQPRDVEAAVYEGHKVARQI